MIQPTTSILSVIINFALKTVLIFFSVMVVLSCGYTLFINLSADKLYAVQIVMLMIIIIVPFVLGWLIAKKHPGHTIALLFLIMAYSSAAETIAVGVGHLNKSLPTPYTAVIDTVILVLENTLWVPGAAFPLLLMPLYFPTGKLLSPRWRPLVIFVLGNLAWYAIRVALRPWPSGTNIPDTRPINGIPGSEPFFDAITNVLTILFVLALPLFPVAVFLRYRRSVGVERIQMKWPLAALVLGLLLAVIFVVLPGLAAIDAELGYPIALSLTMLFPISLGIAILRHRLFDIDILLNRTLVYGILATLIAAIYVAIVGGLGALFQAQTNTLNGLVAAAIIAVLFQPVRDRLQRAINRLLYGERDDPAAVLTRLAHHLETADTPTAILPNLVRTIAHLLKIPHAAIWLPVAADRMEPVAVWGAPSDPVHTIPLIYQNEAIGHLVVAPRGPHDSFSRHEQQLLNTIAALTANTVRAVQLSDELRRSRQHIVSAREEERRRLRRDLHDGLGPRLASQSLKLEAARDSLRHDLDRAEALLASVLEKSQDMIADVRQLVYGLRPPALDELGLTDALREYVRQTHLNGAEVTLTTSPEGLPALPAAVEVAGYRIVQEALNNVTCHAHARTCQIAVKLVTAGPETTLRLEIRDDGIGLSQPHPTGIGTLSMRERAEELGGRCTIEPIPDGGTRVCVEIPVNHFDGGHHEG